MRKTLGILDVSSFAQHKKMLRNGYALMHGIPELETGNGFGDFALSVISSEVK